MKHSLFAILALLTVMSSPAQQALNGGSKIVSPQIHPDNTVTFRILAPKATEVYLTGDFMVGQPDVTPSGTINLTKADNGMWEYTTPVALSPELYSYTFFVDSLRTMDPSNVYAIRDIATVTNVFLIDSVGSKAHLYRVNDVPHGTVSKVWYNSPGLDMNRRLTIYTPPGYEDSDRSYPVLYLLHGSGGDEEAWPSLGRATQILDNLIAQGQAEPMIVVMPNGNAPQEAAPGESALGFVVPTAGVSRMNRGSIELSFPDVVSFVDTHYRTIADKQHRAIAGLSMGGFHSMHISKQYPDMFDYIGLFSAAIWPPENSDSPVYQDMEGKLRTQFEKKPALYWIAIGNSDFLYDANKQYRTLLDANNYPYTYVESNDGHIWRNWRIYLSDFIPLLFKNNQ